MAQAATAERLRRLLDPSTIVLVALAAALIVLVGLPIFKLLSLSVHGPGGFTVDAITHAFGKADHLAALGRSLFIGVAVAVISTCVGVPMAWLVSRSNMPGGNFVTLVAVAIFVMPPYLGAVARMLLAGPNAGWINRAWGFLSAEEHLLNIYSLEGIIFMIALYSIPFNFIFAKSALDVVPTELKDAASILGASRFVATVKITLPMIWPAILGGVIIVLLESITSFGTPALLGIPAGITVATTQLWQFFEFRPRLDAACAYSLSVIGVTILLLWLQRRFLRRKGFTALTGKGGEAPSRRSRALALAVLRVVHGGGGARGVHATDLPVAGGLRQGMGSRLLAVQSHSPEIRLSAVQEQLGARLDLEYGLVLGRGRHCSGAGCADRCLRPGAPPDARNGAAAVPVHGADRDPRHRAGGRFLRALRRRHRSRFTARRRCASSPLRYGACRSRSSMPRRR